MIGDTTFDALMSRAAGVAMVGVSWGYHPVEALREAGAHRIVDRFADAPGALRALGVLPGLESGGTAPIFPS
jgi:phosphoglycolate phosphatase